MAVYVPDVEQVGGTLDRRGALHHDRAVADLKDAGVLAHLPTVEALSVEEARKTGFRLRRIAAKEQSTSSRTSRKLNKGLMERSSLRKWFPDIPKMRAGSGSGRTQSLSYTSCPRRLGPRVERR